MDVELNNESKVQILISALEERYKALHIIRERIHSVCLWALGILLGAGGWLIQSEKSLSYEQRIFFSIIVMGAVITLRCFYLADLCRGFRTQQRIAAGIEKRFKLFDKDASNESVYPSSWQHAGSENGEGRFVNTNYLLIYAGSVILLLILWLHT